jgi:hypothetical protein
MGLGVERGEGDVMQRGFPDEGMRAVTESMEVETCE